MMRLMRCRYRFSCPERVDIAAIHTFSKDRMVCVCAVLRLSAFFLLFLLFALPIIAEISLLNDLPIFKYKDLVSIFD